VAGVISWAILERSSAKLINATIGVGYEILGQTDGFGWRRSLPLQLKLIKSEGVLLHQRAGNMQEQYL